MSKNRKYKQAPQLIVTLKAARRILGSESDSFTDEELTALIQDVDLLAQAFIKMVQKDEDILNKLGYSMGKSK